MTLEAKTKDDDGGGFHVDEYTEIRDRIQEANEEVRPSQVTIPETTTPSTPSAGELRIYPKSDGNLYQLKSDGSERKVGAADFGDDDTFSLGDDDDVKHVYNSSADQYEIATDADVRVEDSSGGGVFLIDQTNSVLDIFNKDLNNVETAEFNNLNTAPTQVEGQVWYSEADRSLVVDTDLSGVKMNVGQEEFTRVYNNTGSTISNGDAVYVSGNHGNTGLPTIALAKADAETTAEFAGLATHDIANASEGFITISGIVRDLDTSSFSAGDQLWLSASTAGNLTNTEPSSPSFSVRVGRVTKSTSTTGEIVVQHGNARESIYTGGSVPFADSNGKLIEDSTNLTWDSDTNTFDAANITEGGTGVVLETRTLTGGDGIQSLGDLSADRTVAVAVSDFAGTGLESDGGSPADLRIAAGAAGDGLQGGGGSALAVDVSDFAGTFLSDDGSENLTVDIGDGLETDGAADANIRTQGDAIAGNALTEGASPHQVAVATDGIQTDELDQSIAPTWTDTHTFNGGVDASGSALMSVPNVAGDPASPSDGDIWYDTSNNRYRGQENGTIVTFSTS